MYDEFETGGFESFETTEPAAPESSVEDLSGLMDMAPEGPEPMEYQPESEMPMEYNPEDPQWQAANDELLAEMDETAVSYEDTPEGGEQTVADWMDEVPQEAQEQISYDLEDNPDFIASLLEDNPDLASQFGNGEFLSQGNNEFGFEGTCGETTQANTFNELLGTIEFTENSAVNIALDCGLCEVNPDDLSASGGTNTEQFLALYDEMNHRSGDQLEINCFDFDDALNTDQMADAIENGSVLNIAVDSNVLWDQPADALEGDHYTDHWISVDGVERDPDGNIMGFSIIDSGGGETYLDVDKFEDCYYGTVDNPVMDPTCIVVSRKGN